MPVLAGLRETGSTSSRAWVLQGRRSTGRPTRWWAEIGFTFSLVVALVSPCPLRAAEQLEVQFDGVVIPVAIKDLVTWGRSGGVSDAELSIWLDLLEPASRQGMLELLRAPLITDRSMARQMLNSWAGRRLLDEVADLVRVDDDTIGVTVLSTLERLLQEKPQVTSLDLLEALPAERVRLDLDGLVQVAAHWREQLQRQQALVARLDRIPLQAVLPPAEPAVETLSLPTIQALQVSHRTEPLELQLWQPKGARRASQASDRPWVVLMPGLGGPPTISAGWAVCSANRAGLWWCWNTPAVIPKPWGPGFRAIVALPALKCCLIAFKTWRLCSTPRPMASFRFAVSGWCWWGIPWERSPRCWRPVCARSRVWSGDAVKLWMICR